MSVYDNLVGMEEVLDDFIVETAELLEEINEELINLEGNPDPDNVNKIFRAFHTFKGTCGFLGFDQAKDIAHVAEDLLNGMRNNELQPNAHNIDLLLEACDWFSQFTEDVKERVDREYEIDSLVERLKGARSGDDIPEPAATALAEPPPDAAVENGAAETATNGEVEPAPAVEAAPAADDNGQATENGNVSTGSVFANLEGMEEILNEFIIESNELLEEAGADILHLESDPEPELVNRLFRAFHTFKGTCGFLGFIQAKDVAHVAEDILNQIRSGELVADPHIVDALLKACDWFAEFVNDVKDRTDKSYDIGGLIRLLREAGGGTSAATPADANGQVEPALEPVAAAGNNQPQVEAQAEAEVPSPVQEPMPAPPPTPAPATKPKPADDSGAKATTQTTIRVDMSRLENLMNLAGELVLNRNQLGQAYTTLAATKTGDPAIDNLDQVNNSLGRITTEIQEAVMQMRMLPISNVFRKYPRVVRDLARDSGKQLQLIMEGEQTELDRSVIEAISDPLLHLVRNAADHGIESPQDRIAAGKPELGTIILKAAHEGNHIVIEVSDDGAGMDADILSGKAVEKGVITAAEAETFSYREKLNLIFRPGFSLAEKVTDVSGRGVGMDVVSTNIGKLNGAIDIDTKLGEGSRFIIKLPLTLAIVTGLKVAVWDEDFIIPFGSIIETVKLKESELTKVEDKWVMRFRDSVVNTLFIDEWFKVKSPPDNERREYYAVIVSVAEFRYGLVVTDLKGQEEAVIKPLGEALGRIPGIAGGTIGGDGQITLILDVPELIHHMGLG